MGTNEDNNSPVLFKLPWIAIELFWCDSEVPPSRDPLFENLPVCDGCVLCGDANGKQK